MLLEGALLVGERLVEATDGTGTGGDPHQGLGHFSHLPGLGARFRSSSRPEEVTKSPV